MEDIYTYIIGIVILTMIMYICSFSYEYCIYVLLISIVLISLIKYRYDKHIIPKHAYLAMSLVVTGIMIGLVYEHKLPAKTLIPLILGLILACYSAMTVREGLIDLTEIFIAISIILFIISFCNIIVPICYNKRTKSI